MIDVATGHFSDDASFDTVIQRYEFDKRLRSILFAAIEILEVGLRTKFITTLSLATNSGLWYLDLSLFDNRLIKNARRARRMAQTIKKRF